MNRRTWSGAKAWVTVTRDGMGALLSLCIRVIVRLNPILNLPESSECALIPSQWDNLFYVSGKTSC